MLIGNAARHEMHQHFNKIINALFEHIEHIEHIEQEKIASLRQDANFNREIYSLSHLQAS